MAIYILCVPVFTTGTPTKKRPEIASRDLFKNRQAAIIRASQPLFVALYSYGLFGQTVSGQQFVGGMVILSGVVLILLPGSRLRLPKQLWRSARVAQSDTQNIVGSQDRPAQSPANL